LDEEGIHGRRKDLFNLIKRGSERDIIYCSNSLKPKMHAEMKILTEVKERLYLEEEEGYIGISKLCCTPCQLMINIVNKENSEIAETGVSTKKRKQITIKKEKGFYTRGTHGGTYSKWQVPNFYQNELIEKLEELTVKKTYESTSEDLEFFPLVLQPPK